MTFTSTVTADEQPLNVVFITVDDMNCDSVGAFGCPIPNITPNLDRLASEGMRFEHAHVSIAICQPTRSVWMTGRHPHRNGALGFDPINTNVPTLQESLRDAGYLNGILSKNEHLKPKEKFCWDFEVAAAQLTLGRGPQDYYEKASEFFALSAEQGKPFFLMANSNDPHRPFAGSDQEKGRNKPKKNNRKNKQQSQKKPASRYPSTPQFISPEETVLPGFLPDLPEIRLELAEYFTSVHRADETVGAILKAIDDAGLRDSTIVFFMSDHGMPLPFAKTNCYYHSTRTPLIVRWPGVVEPNSIDKKHMVAGIDFMPTVLDALRLETIDGMDGHSYVPVLRGEPQPMRDHVFTSINTLSSKKAFPMRSLLTRKYGLIYNAWADGETAFRNESMSGRTFKAMQDAAADDPKVAARVKHFQYRTRLELYDYVVDPNALNNVIDDPFHQEIKQELIRELLQEMKRTNDPQYAGFAKLVEDIRE